MIKMLAKYRKPKVDWNLNWEFIKWLNKWFKEYKKNASKIVDLTYRVYQYGDREMTQIEIIDRIIELTDNLLFGDNFFMADEEEIDMIDEIFDLFHRVFWSMWW